MKQNQSCFTCVHCNHAGAQDLDKGTCRERPPQVSMFPVRGPVGQTGMQTVTNYPPVKLKDVGCSRYKPKLEVVDAKDT